MNFLQKPKTCDPFILSFFVILLTLQPYFFNGNINLFEVGLYLPGINSILNGGIPYRDFFHLRGPLDIYMPAILMKMFGTHIKVLYSYFYFGNVLCLILCVWIAKELYQTRYLLYLFVPVLVGRTFPRVVFTYWGGMRYAFGLLVVLCAIKFFNRKKYFWIVLAGIFTACGMLTSVEMGVFAIGGVIGGLLFLLFFRFYSFQEIKKAFLFFAVGFLVIVLPFAGYFTQQGALLPYIDSVETVIFHSHGVMNQRHIAHYPRDVWEAIAAMFNPISKNFRHLTPAYLYLFLLAFFCVACRKKKILKGHAGVICLALYGVIMYIAAFRSLWASQFEMALQPEKILLFFNLEIVLLYFLKKKKLLLIDIAKHLPLKWYDYRKMTVYFFNFCFIGLFCSSVGYPIQRFNKRFFSFQYVRDKITSTDTAHLKPLSKEDSRLLEIERARGIEVSLQQADELEQVQAFLKNNTAKDEVVLMYPELGTYHFLYDRPFLGRFPMATFTWFNDQWHHEFIEALESQKPRYVVMEKEFTENKIKVYFAYKPNEKKYKEVMAKIRSYYQLVLETNFSYIYQRK